MQQGQRKESVLGMEGQSLMVGQKSRGTGVHQGQSVATGAEGGMRGIGKQ